MPSSLLPRILSIRNPYLAERIPGPEKGHGCTFRLREFQIGTLRLGGEAGLAAETQGARRIATGVYQ